MSVGSKEEAGAVGVVFAVIFAAASFAGAKPTVSSERAGEAGGVTVGMHACICDKTHCLQDH